MARTKGFDQADALQKAIRVFGMHGFSATSPDALMEVMGIGRQSMYDTFGNKRALFLKALDTYVEQSARLVGGPLEGPELGLAAIRRALIAFVERDDITFGSGCMAMNAVGEFGVGDPDVTAIFGRHRGPHRQRLLKAFGDAQRRGELAPEAELEHLVAFFDSMLTGIRTAAKMQTSRAELHVLVDMTMTALTRAGGERDRAASSEAPRPAPRVRSTTRHR